VIWAFEHRLDIMLLRKYVPHLIKENMILIRVVREGRWRSDDDVVFVLTNVRDAS
jgi:hypothetical protein